MNASLHVGTSGWNYAHWKGPFYPDDLSQHRWLAYYAERFETVEINNSFYRLPSAETVVSWRDTVPDGFVFSFKANGYITHMKKLKDPNEPLGNLYERAEVLGGKLGPFLFQLPPRWHFDEARLDAFLKALSVDHRHVFEFRDESWFHPRALDLLRDHGAGFCIYELAGTLSPKEVTANFAYVRLHGPGDKYQGLYDPQTLAGWYGTFSAWEDRLTDVYCYFDNDEKGYAVENAQALVGFGGDT